MQNWIDKSGSPVVNVYINNKLSTIQIVQKANNPHVTTKWFIPLKYILSSNVTHIKFLWLNAENAHINIQKSINNNTWILFNANQQGFLNLV